MPGGNGNLPPEWFPCKYKGFGFIYTTKEGADELRNMIMLISGM